MTKRERLARLAGLVATLLPVAPGQVAVVTDTVPGFGAVGGVAPDAPVPDHALAKARLELVAPGS